MWYVLIYTVMASSSAVSDPAGARRLGNASIGMSIAGIVVIIVVVIIIGAVLASAPTRAADSYSYSSSSSSSSSSSRCPNYYYIYGTRCYKNKTYVGSNYCSGVRSGNWCYKDRYYY